eukprot:TRINITY_DN3222_c0_g1_i1.p2 TRINITY_DN3222_c0_g1~~TRINITY_DN3222_c0_g1_i1.p2  ORF type:complete len:104 (+),score=4.74 TRINITY_DN3222_c0_g1_i1:66-377(+)
MPLIWPISKPNAASSNGFCIWPRWKGPKSPPRLALLQSLSFLAKSSKEISPDSIRLRKPSKRAIASAFVRVIVDSFQDAGRRESRCFTKRCDARTFCTGAGEL